MLASVVLDWPGCYGSIVVPSTDLAIDAAEEAFPERPLEAQKAWREMIHRYAASVLGFFYHVARSAGDI